MDALAGGSASFVLGEGHSGDEWSVDFFVSFDTLRGDGAMFLGRDLTERRRLERQLLTVTDAEQQRIGADLHDGLGQELTGLACLAAAMRDRLKNAQPQESAQAELIARLANEATVKSRALAHGLSPVQLEVHGLPSALEDLVYQCQRLHSIDCAFVLRGEPPAIDHLAAIHLYRIAQEAIHNAVRHGEAEQVRVALITRPTRHRLLILDDGKGFDQRTRSGNGRGLSLMNYRANMLGGSITVWSGPGQGTRVYCDWSRSVSLTSSESHSHEDRNNCIPSPDRSVA
jgi:signal transduction histidine kinase